MAKSKEKKSAKKIRYQHFIIVGAFIFSILLASTYFLKDWQAKIYQKESEAAAASTIFFDPATIIIGSGKTFDLNAKINPGSNKVTAAQLNIAFDKSKFNINSFTVNSANWGTVLQAPKWDNATGTASVTVGITPGDSNAYIISTTTIATIRFSAVGTSGSSAINFSSETQVAAMGEAGNVLVTKNGTNITFDTTPPTLSQVTPFPSPSNNKTPSYTFSSTEAGTIVFEGDCSSATTAAVAGNNTIKFNALSDGTHSNCTIKVTDSAGNQSVALNIFSFVIDTVTPTLSEVTKIITPGNYKTPAYTFSSTEAGIIVYGGDCSSVTTSAVSGGNVVAFNTLADGTHSNCTIKVADSAGNQSVALTVSSFTIDTTAPVRSGGLPSGTLPVRTMQTSVSLSTGENATCRYSANSGIAYSSMAAFSATGAKSHSTSVSGLVSGKTYHYYVRCIDSLSNSNTDDYDISFSVAATITGDINKDLIVDIYDYSILITNFNSSACGNEADINGDCKVNIYDYNILIGNFGKSA